MKSFFRHFSNVCKEASVVLIGGDTTKSESKLFISITAIGTAATENIKYRSTAKVDDIICVAGNLGYAHLGLVACEQSLNDFEEYKSSFLRPEAKVKEGIWLAGKQSVTSMMDLSDGLYIDLKRLCNASGAGAAIKLESLIPSSVFAANCNSTGLDSVNIMLTGGEDYCLLFTVQNNFYETLSQEFLKNFGYGIKPIGRIIEGSGVHIIENGKLVNLKLQPFTHFGEKT
jgi:thiamine-monophosphate kinase